MDEVGSQGLLVTQSGHTPVGNPALHQP